MPPKLSLIHEQTSPLFRIMSVSNINEPGKRQFENNRCAFHIGNGLVLSIAHTLRMPVGFLKSIDAYTFDNEIAPNLDKATSGLYDKYYTLNEETGKRYISTRDPRELQELVDTNWNIKFDSRWQTLYGKKICSPYLIIQFDEEAFYGDTALHGQFNEKYMMDAIAGKHTYMVELELQQAFYTNDIAVYKMVNVSEEIISKIPVIDNDTRFLDIGEKELFAIQCSPANEAGRLVNTAAIEGILDHSNSFGDPVEGNYAIKGLRYLIKGYFRFGSSGAPYVFFDEEKGKYVVNAIQSEASPIQLSINNNREGNYQYINAIATPLYNVRKELEKLVLAGV